MEDKMMTCEGVGGSLYFPLGEGGEKGTWGKQYG